MTSVRDIIHLNSVCKTYTLGRETFAALQDITLTIEQGSFWAIMGPSGSGKSTLLNLLGCLDVASSGNYHLNGREISTLSDDQLSDIRLRNLGFIFQSFNLVPQLTVGENVELPLFYLGWDDKRCSKRAMELIERVGLLDRLQHRPNELSGGEQQRVAIARALANNPDILLADEPTGNLDSGTSHQIMTLLAELNQQGKTIVMVTHEVDIAAFANHRLYLRDGRIFTI